MRRIVYFVLCLLLAVMFLTSKSNAQANRSEIAVGYGFYSIYSLVNGPPFNASSGTPSLTYRYYITRDVTLGLGFGSEDIRNWGSFTTIAPELTVCYLDTRHDYVRVRLYGSVSYGITIFSDNDLGAGKTDQSGVWAYGFQATPFGIRIGRKLAFFTEIGVGYKGLFHCGLDFRFPRTPVLSRHHDEN